MNDDKEPDDLFIVELDDRFEFSTLPLELFAEDNSGCHNTSECGGTNDACHNDLQCSGSNPGCSNDSRCS